jgi:hypothetical protein
MAKLEEVLDHNARRRKEPKPELDHLRVYESDNGGHAVEHHFGPYGSADEELHTFPKPVGKPSLPKGHVLTHIAKAMHIPHEVVSAEKEVEESGG